MPGVGTIPLLTPNSDGRILRVNYTLIRAAGANGRGKGSGAMLRSFTSYHPGLLTDLYHPDAAYISWRTGRNGQTTFDLLARRAPFDSAFMLVAGLETALEFVREFRYSDEDLYFLTQIRDYDPRF